jgi:hypothetical protein
VDEVTVLNKWNQTSAEIVKLISEGIQTAKTTISIIKEK